MNRTRKNIDKHLIDEIYEYFSKFSLENKLTLPIIYKTDELQTIDYSCIVKDRLTDKVLTVIIYDKDDDEIHRILNENGEILLEKFKTYYSKKVSCFYDGWNSVKKPKSYTGTNWLCGLQRYFHPIEKKQMINYHKRKSIADDDDEFLRSMLKVYCGIYHLEKKYLPKVAEKRLELSKLSPFSTNFPIELNPSTTLGASINFSNKPHSDSCVKGMMESIIFKERSKMDYIFCNYEANIEFKIKGCCIIFQDGKTLHGTKNTGNHEGIGFVNITKSNLVCKTEHTNKLYKTV